MRETARKLAPALAKYAVEETGYGRFEDKLKKNLLCVDKTPGTEAAAADRVLRRRRPDADRARAATASSAAITPTTNPTETIINNGIGMVAGGNAVVFNAHPYAARTSAFLIHHSTTRSSAAGGPENLLACVERPTIESAETLMKLPGRAPAGRHRRARSS